MTTSAIREALPSIVICPKCGACNLTGTTPYLTREQNGTWTCAVCATNFTETQP